MKNLYFNKTFKTTAEKCRIALKACLAWLVLGVITPSSSVSAQVILFDFDNAPIYTSLPINQTAGAITAHLSATAQGYSIQDANVLGFTPPGFAGHVIYPNSIYLADLLIGFDQTLTDFSIMYSCQELGCDDAATMRVTAYMNGNFIGTNTMTASVPGTWPVETLSCSFIQGFDSVVVHYDSPPPTCQDYGVIFMADNMRVTPSNTAVSDQKGLIQELTLSNPVSESGIISFSLLHSENVNIVLYDISGRMIKTLFQEYLSLGMHRINLNIPDDIVNGLYLLKVNGESFSKSCKLMVLK